MLLGEAGGESSTFTELSTATGKGRGRSDNKIRTCWGGLECNLMVERISCEWVDRRMGLGH